MIFRRRKSVANGARSTPRCIGALALVLAWAPTMAGEAGAGDRHGLEPGDPKQGSEWSFEAARNRVADGWFAKPP